MKILSKVISNSSPIIGLSKLGLLNILWEMFDEVFVPQAVYNEIVLSDSQNVIGKAELNKAVRGGNIKVYHVKNQELVNQFFGKLHKGELETIVGARELNLEYLLLDERAARNFAEVFSLEPTGLIGVLILAKAMGKISEIKVYLDVLIRNNYRISKQLYTTILSEQGELCC